MESAATMGVLRPRAPRISLVDYGKAPDDLATIGNGAEQVRATMARVSAWVIRSVMRPMACFPEAAVDVASIRAARGAFDGACGEALRCP